MNKVFKISIIVVICLVVILGIAVLLGQYSDAGTTNPPSCTEHVDNDNNHLCDVCSESLESTSFTETNDKVYVIPSQLNLRKNPGETGVATVAASMDDELTRIGYYVDGENAGWSKIVYNGEEYYVATDCITIQKPIADADFTFVEETVYGITKNTFIWSKPSHIENYDYSARIATLFIGQRVTRLGVANVVFVDNEGIEYTFAKIQFEDENGELRIGYVNNEYLTTDPSYLDSGLTFTPDECILVVTATTLNLRTSAQYPADNIGAQVGTGVELITISKATGDDGTVWYKVNYNNKIYYVIYNENHVEIKIPVTKYPSGVEVSKFKNTLTTSRNDIKILQLTDLHINGQMEMSLVFNIMKTVITRSEPDLIVITGDVFSNGCEKDDVAKLCEFMEQFNIPWAVVFGNHDKETPYSFEELSEILENSKDSLFKRGDLSDRYGNYYYYVQFPDGRTEQLIFMDTREDGFTEESVAFYENAVLDSHRFDSDQKTNNLLFYHIPLRELNDAISKYENDSSIGSGTIGEPISAQDTSVGFFDKVLELGRTKAMIYGHDHYNNAIINYMGVDFCYGTKTGIAGGHNYQLGGNLITLNSNGEYSIERMLCWG